MQGPLQTSKTPAPVVSLNNVRCQRVDRARGTLQESWDVYVASGAFDRLKQSSKPVYKHAALLAIASLPARPSPSDVTLWLESLVRDGKSPATVNKYLGALKSITERASYVTQNTDLRIRNAFKANRPFRLPAKERRDADQATVRRLLVLARNSAERLALRLAAFYGLRRGEILGLQPADVRSDGGALRIRIERTRDSHGVRMRKNAKNGKPHWLSIEGDTETAALVLECARYERRVEMCHKHQRHLAEQWLLPWGHERMNALMRRFKADPEVGLGRGDSWHALRHYGATALAAAGKGVTEIQAWLGDSTYTAAMTYMGQVRGTTQGTAAVVLASFERSRGDDAGGEGATKPCECDACKRQLSTPKRDFDSNLEGDHNSNLDGAKSND